MNVTSFDVRGFPVDTPARWQLEESARQFTMGFEFAIEQNGNDAIIERLETLEKEFRGFAYEGACMALTLRDVMSFKPGNENLESFVGGPAAHQVFMAYIGIGFALARLPKFLWRKALPDQSKLPDSPALNWIIIDGYSFHESFFHTDKWIGEQHISPRVPWHGPHDYVLRVMDQGIGRAMWFINGGDVDRLANMISSFAPQRRADLWSGAALAITYAGGVGEDGLTDFVKKSWDYHPEVAQGSVFAIKQRVLSDLVTPHTELASQILCEKSPEEASALADQSVINLPDGGSVPDYEVFRQRIQSNFSA